MFTLEAAQTFAGGASVASQLTCTIEGMELTAGPTETYKVLYQGQLSNAIATLYTVPGSTSSFIKTISVVNNDSVARTFQFAVGGTTAAHFVTGVISLGIGYTAYYEDGEGWEIYDANGAYIQSIATPLTTKGDLGVFTTLPTRLGVGTDGQVLAADSSAASGLRWVNPTLNNFSTASQNPTGAGDVYIAGSALTVPAGKVKIGTQFRWKFDVTKTGAGTAAIVVKVFVGTNGSTGDTARLTFTFGAQTGVIDVGWFEVIATVRGPLSGSGVLVGVATLIHSLAATGLDATNGQVLSVVSGTFDVTVANTIYGLSINPGTSGNFTIQMVQAEAINLLV